ncbi:esterase/lipase family protein [Rubrivirga marina]|uniref:GPI inositol-deacylase PGAP1-like alpha/beta domain-containing protein n=1 Tax=Rubrivirga marina TaxID=1196024 RepID=A0A271IV36_9BACT|nr:permease [Rubrivirga marina]PAP75121.1 hypothetical protein BSZ37_00990 [Rubrivirga marina]
MPPPVSDLRGAARLAARTVVGVTDIVEAAHATITRPVGRPRRTRGITGLVYRIVRAMTRGVARLLDRGLATVEPFVVPADAPPAAREALVAALNGAFGDALDADANPLATTTHLRHDGRPLDLGALPPSVAVPSDVLLVQVHGICMHDGQWGTAAHDPGAVLADALGATRLAVRYNSGRHVSENGRDVADLLDRAVTAWPVPVRRLVIVGHSMGGLVARSAFEAARAAGHDWPTRDVALVTLGTPHHGAPLERIGNAVDALLGATRWGAPYARLGQARSAGVTDLRFGSVHPDDWAERDRFERAPDARRHVPLPDNVTCYFVAATTGDGRGGVRDQTLGDGLVPLDSALGRHADPARTLTPHDRWTAPGLTHFDLLHRPEVTARLVGWLA